MVDRKSREPSDTALAEISYSPFLWTPGLGPDAAALKRMRNAFPCPATAMGEAWFMSEQRVTFPLLLGELDALPNRKIRRPLEEIASGPCSFGQLDEWTQWFHYLLPRLIPRVHGAWSLVGVLVTGFMAQHPDGLGNPSYPEFATDALLTLGRCVMAPICWPDGALDIETCLGKHRIADGRRLWLDASEALSSSLFFCAKYLPSEAVQPWFASTLAIADPRWTAQMMVWLVGAHPILTGEVTQPADLAIDHPFNVGWDSHHALSGNYSGDLGRDAPLSQFLPPENSQAILRVVRTCATLDKLVAWDEAIKADRDLAVEAAGLADYFADLYGLAS